ncbi:XRE family transcriptional regulator [Alicyclobacillus fastidiosus]|uniref:XRE family transcriptional regulator n=1 Tax=Alicyclobacillus fastidiosus TaxID=392011 RepID=A0ABY6ZBU7_9BACL|nr:XRE family transcriptional regulator [Alicyclobacillus fastidiosus]WAH39726.1 XRE family transcriptional regulator [Alicyclobacillus fastidiosus]GMA60953.1 DNA-binding protein [Alicyclobacillus fastidiosus]
MEQLFNRIRALRQENKMTLQELSDRSGLSVSFLSQVERGNSSLTITSLQRIAEAFGIPMAALFEAAENKNFVVRADDQKPFQIEGASMTYIRLAGNFAGRNLEPMIVELLPNQSIRTKYGHPGEEFYYVLEGKILLQVGDEDYVLAQGDALHFPSSIQHTMENLLERPSKLLCVLQPAIFQ